MKSSAKVSLRKRLVAFDERDVQPGRLRDLGIVAGDRARRSSAMGGEDVGNSGTPAGSAPGGNASRGALPDHQRAVGDGRGCRRRGRAGIAPRCSESAASSRSITARGRIGPRGIVDQHQIRRIGFQHFERVAHRRLPRRAADDQLHARNSGQRCLGQRFAAFGYRDHDRRRLPHAASASAECRSTGLPRQLANCLGMLPPARRPFPAATITAAKAGRASHAAARVAACRVRSQSTMRLPVF